MDLNDKINILLVDDRPENLFTLEAILSSSHYNLVRANSGEEALRWLLKEEFALVLLDVQMPGMDGFETAKLIKARDKCKSIPIIFVTAISKEAEHIFKGYSVDAVDYMLKPFEPEILKAKVDSFVNIHCTQKGIILQADILRRKTEELEEAHKQLSQTVLELRHISSHY